MSKLWFFRFVFLLSSLAIGFQLIINGNMPGHSVPIYGQRPCLKSQYGKPFSGISSCDWVNSLCAATSSIFTWTSQDRNVDTGYERVKDFFVSQGWRNFNYHNNHYETTRLSSGFIEYNPNEVIVNPQAIWQKNREQQHITIAYSVLVPIGLEPLRVFVTQFEYLAHSLDVNGLPVAGAKPLRSRLWGLKVKLATDTSAKISQLYAFYPSLGQVIWDADKPIPLTHEQQKYYIPLSIKTPPIRQNLTQRWSCQRIDYTTPRL